ncbi:MAG: hydantoinase B/oxoprolinase family protein [Dehalococcoidia bacterium]|nr:hydantoinase B/oxoprolinase family protein [Dehalococcoidia bacterium]
MTAQDIKQEKGIYRYEVPLGGRRTHVGGGWLPSREEVAEYERLSPVDFEILSYRMHSICNEARQAILRVSGSPVVAEGGEALFAIYDPHGHTSSLACGLLLHTVGTQGNIKEVLEVQAEAPGIYDGDIFMLNEPSIGGYHACDQWTGTPVFHQGELIAWLGSLTHTAETGAIEPGGIAASARSLLDEGYRVQGIKVQEKGKINRAAINCLLRSSRDPAYYVLDLRARIAGLNVAKERFGRLLERYGVDKVKAAIQQNMDYAEEMARAKLRNLADGTWRFLAYMDWDVGPGPKLIKILTTMTKEGDTLTLDFEAPPPNQGYYNCYPPGAFGLVFVALASQLFWETPGNYGFLRPLNVYFPSNSCLNIPYLAPCGLCAAFPVTEAVTGTIAKMLYTNKQYWPDINAPWQRTCTAGVFWGGLTQHGYPSGSLFSESWAVGTGAGVDEGRGDGCDTGGMMMTVESCVSDVEMMELQSPFMFLWRREGLDTAGPGRWRGGASISYGVIPHNSPFVALGFTAIGAYGDTSQSLDGSYPPAMESSCEIARGTNILEAFKRQWIPQSLEDLHKLVEESGGTIETVKSPRPVLPVAADKDVIASVFGGARGIGDPLDREPERVLEDVNNKITSLEMARRVYGVAIDPKTLTVDLKATETLREEVKANRRKRGKIWEGSK